VDSEPWVIDLGTRITEEHVPWLCRRLHELVADGCRIVVLDAGALMRADLDAVEALARLQLAARRLGGEVRLRNVGPDVREVLNLAGVLGIVRAEDGSYP